MAVISSLLRDLRAPLMRAAVCTVLRKMPPADRRVVLNRLRGVSDDPAASQSRQDVPAMTYWQRGTGWLILMNPRWFGWRDQSIWPHLVAHEMAHIFCGLTGDHAADEKAADNVVERWGFKGTYELAGDELIVAEDAPSGKVPDLTKLCEHIAALSLEED